MEFEADLPRLVTLFDGACSCFRQAWPQPSDCTHPQNINLLSKEATEMGLG